MTGFNATGIDDHSNGPGVDSELIDKYLAGECTASERAIVESWRNARQGTDAEARIIELRRVLVAEYVESDSNSSSAAVDVARCGNAILQARRSRGVKNGRSIGGSIRGWVAGTGAVLSIVLLAVITRPFAKHYFQVNQDVVTSTYTSPAGTRATVNLKDGTRVVLAPATKIQVSGQTVTLTGQALFTVVHKSESPFTVIAGNTRTIVLGTTFAVRAYPNDTVRVVVAEGRVQLRSSVSEMSDRILGSGEAALVDASGSVSVASSINLDAALGWANGKMVFDHTPFANVLAELERTYNAKLKVDDNVLAQRKLTGAFSFESLSDALNTLSVLLDARYTHNADGITFTRSR